MTDWSAYLVLRGDRRQSCYECDGGGDYDVYAIAAPTAGRAAEEIARWLNAMRASWEPEIPRDSLRAIRVRSWKGRTIRRLNVETLAAEVLLGVGR